MVRMEDKFGVPITENTFYKDGQGAVKLITKDKKGKLVFTGRQIDGSYTLTAEIANTLFQITDIKYYLDYNEKETNWIETELSKLEQKVAPPA